VAINSDMASNQNLVSLGVILGKISVDVRVADVNGYVVARGGDPVVVRRFSAGSNLNRFVITRRRAGRVCQAGRQKYEKKPPNRRSHGGRRRYRSLPGLQR